MMKQPAPFNGKSDLISGGLAGIGRETSVSNHYIPILFGKKHPETETLRCFESKNRETTGLRYSETRY